MVRNGQRYQHRIAVIKKNIDIASLSKIDHRSSLPTYVRKSSKTMASTNQSTFSPLSSSSSSPSLLPLLLCLFQAQFCSKGEQDQWRTWKVAHRIANNHFLKLSKDLEDFKDLKWAAETVQQLPPPDHHHHHLKLALLTGLTDGHS